MPAGRRDMQVLRHWSVRHAAGLKRFYDAFARTLPYLDRATRLVGRARSERLLTPVERVAKGAIFDCRMCGQCVLSSTGMACPTNCAKEMRNGPCGGVRADGTCEVDPAMRCVWVEATDGRKRIAHGQLASALALPPMDHRMRQRSSWLRLIDGNLPKSIIPEPVEADPGREIHAFEQACRSDRFFTEAASRSSR